MAVTIISIKCPECGASLNIENNRTRAFCSYCGAKIIINNENEYTYRHIDEAGIKQAETEQIIRLKQMELAEKERISSEKTKRLKIVISLIILFVGVVLMAVGFLAGSASGDSDSGFYALGIIGLLLFMSPVFILTNNKKDEDKS